MYHNNNMTLIMVSRVCTCMCMCVAVCVYVWCQPQANSAACQLLGGIWEGDIYKALKNCFHKHSLCRHTAIVCWARSVCKFCPPRCLPHCSNQALSIGAPKRQPAFTLRRKTTLTHTHTHATAYDSWCGSSFFPGRFRNSVCGRLERINVLRNTLEMLCKP